MVADQPRVLLADDEETFRLSTATLLRNEGIECDCAQDSEEAGRLLANSYDALISDIRMPGNTQLEFLRDIRARFPSLPILVVTGYPSVQTAVESLRLSFTDYLIKPVDWPDLLRAVVHALRKARMLRMTQEAHQSVGLLAAALDRLRSMASEQGPAMGTRELGWSLAQYLAQSTIQLVTLHTDVQSVLTAYQRGAQDQPTDVCRFMQCPRLEAYREAIVGTIEVLERTKHAFKSKDLGELRRKLEFLKSQDE